MPGVVSQLFGFAGDLRRAKAACERLVLIAGEEFPAERRDLAVILLHCGFLPQVGLMRLCFLTAHRPTYTLDNVLCLTLVLGPWSWCAAMQNADSIKG